MLTPSSFAHPLNDPGGLGLPPYSVALIAVALVAAVVVLAPTGPASAVTPRPGFDDVHRPLGPARRVTRAVVVVVLLGVVYAARRGSGDGLSNIAPPLAVGVAWPALIVGAVCLRRLWTWLDPWDAIARIFDRVGGEPTPPDSVPDPVPDPASGSVWPAVGVALALVYFLVARVDSTQPRAIGVALAAYTIVAIAAGVAFGREASARSEVFGLTARWAGELRDGLAARWAVPRGAEVVLGVLAGGLLLDLSRRSGAYADVMDRVFSPTTAAAQRTLVLSLVLTCVAIGALLYAAERMGETRGLPGGVARAVLPVVLALLVVTKLRRLLVSLQLLPITASDPLGRGWDIFGTSGGRIDANPFGTAGQRWAAVAVVTLAGVVGAVALRRGGGERATRDPASYALYLLVGLAVLGLAAAA